MAVELVVRYVGYGLKCNGCGKRRETTRYTLRESKDESTLDEFLLCDTCQSDGYVIEFRYKPPSGSDLIRKRRIQRSEKMEAELADDVGGKRQPGSGNQDAKADVRIMGRWRIEHKFTDNATEYKLRTSDLNAVIQHANSAGEWPAMIISFTRQKRKFAVLPYEVFRHMMESLCDE